MDATAPTGRITRAQLRTVLVPHRRRARMVRTAGLRHVRGGAGKAVLPHHRPSVSLLPASALSHSLAGAPDRRGSDRRLWRSRRATRAGAVRALMMRERAHRAAAALRPRSGGRAGADDAGAPLQGFSPAASSAAPPLCWPSRTRRGAVSTPAAMVCVRFRRVPGKRLLLFSSFGADARIRSPRGAGVALSLFGLLIGPAAWYIRKPRRGNAGVPSHPNVENTGRRGRRQDNFG